MCYIIITEREMTENKPLPLELGGRSNGQVIFNRLYRLANRNIQKEVRTNALVRFYFSESPEGVYI